MDKPKIYVFVNTVYENRSDVIPQALAEDGTALASHFCSSVGFAKHDMGITSDWKHDIYQKHYPDGYELEWVDNPNSHEGIALACKRCHEQQAAAPQAEKGGK